MVRPDPTCSPGCVFRGRRVFTLVMLIFLCGVSACVPNREPSHTPRTVIEQLLLTQATERSLDELGVPLPPGATLFVEVTGLSQLSSPLRLGSEPDGIMLGPPTDLGYVKDVVAGRLGELGFRLSDREEKADYTARIIVRALGTDLGVILVGIPGFAVLGFAVPDIALYRAQNQIAHMRFSLDIYERRTGRFLRSTPTYTGNAYHDQYTLLFIFTFRGTDLLDAP